MVSNQTQLFAADAPSGPRMTPHLAGALLLLGALVGAPAHGAEACFAEVPYGSAQSQDSKFCSGPWTYSRFQRAPCYKKKESAVCAAGNADDRTKVADAWRERVPTQHKSETWSREVVAGYTTERRICKQHCVLFFCSVSCTEEVSPNHTMHSAYDCGGIAKMLRDEYLPHAQRIDGIEQADQGDDGEL